jgi:hypothetical protein
MKLAQLTDGQWVSPIHRGYRLACCDCGLEHRMDFRIRKGAVQFRATRVKPRAKKIDTNLRALHSGTNLSFVPCKTSPRIRRSSPRTAA